MVCVSPTTILIMAGVRLLPPLVGTVNPSALLHVPLCWIRAMPLSEPLATVATTCVSVQLTTFAAILPSHTAPVL